MAFPDCYHSSFPSVDQWLYKLYRLLSPIQSKGIFFTTPYSCFYGFSELPQRTDIPLGIRRYNRATRIFELIDANT